MVWSAERDSGFSANAEPVFNQVSQCFSKLIQYYYYSSSWINVLSIARDLQVKAGGPNVLFSVKFPVPLTDMLRAAKWRTGVKIPKIRGV